MRRSRCPRRRRHRLGRRGERRNVAVEKRWLASHANKDAIERTREGRTDGGRGEESGRPYRIRMRRGGRKGVTTITDRRRRRRRYPERRGNACAAPSRAVARSLTPHATPSFHHRHPLRESLFLPFSPSSPLSLSLVTTGSGGAAIVYTR